MSAVKTTVVLVEDHLAYRESLRIVLNQTNEFEVVGEVSTAHDAGNEIERRKPDLAVIDFLLPDGNGVSVLRELKRRRLKAKTMFLGRVQHPEILRDAVAAGLGGFASKDQPLEFVLETMQRVANGERNVGLAGAVGVKTSPSEGELPLRALSRREREVLFLLVGGQTSKDIARALYLSTKTVDAHRLHINRKLGVRTPAGLARLMADKGMVT